MGPRWARRRRSGGGSALLLLLGHCWLWAAGADDNGSQLSYYTALINVTVLSPERGGPTLLRIDRGRYGQDSPKVEVKGLLVTPVPINGGNGPAPRRVGARGGGRERRGRNVPEGERQSRAPGRGCGCAVCVCVCVSGLPSELSVRAVACGRGAVVGVSAPTRGPLRAAERRAALPRELCRCGVRLMPVGCFLTNVGLCGA